MNKYTLIGLAVAIVIAIGGYQFPQVQTVTKTVIGAVSTLDGVDNPYVSIGGKRMWHGQVGLIATSSVVLSLLNPLQATSTVTYLSCQSTNVGVGEANNLYFGTTTLASRYATTTANAWNEGFAMGTGQWQYKFREASSTGLVGTLTTNVLEGGNEDGSSNYILKPTEVLYAKFGTSTAGTFATYDAGFCNVTIEKI